MNNDTVSKVLEKDIVVIRTALELGKDYATQVLQGHDMMYKRHPATEGERKEIVDDIVTLNHGLSALSLLAAKEGQGCKGCQTCKWGNYTCSRNDEDGDCHLNKWELYESATTATFEKLWNDTIANMVYDELVSKRESEKPEESEESER